MTTKQRLKAWEYIINGIVEDYQRLDKCCDDAIRVGMMDISGILYTTIWESFTNMMRRIDVEGWIEWYIYDNGCGSKGYSVTISPTNRPISINNIKQLAKVITQFEDL